MDTEESFELTLQEVTMLLTIILTVLVIADLITALIITLWSCSCYDGVFKWIWVFFVGMILAPFVWIYELCRFGRWCFVEIVDRIKHGNS